MSSEISKTIREEEGIYCNIQLNTRVCVHAFFFHLVPIDSVYQVHRQDLMVAVNVSVNHTCIQGWHLRQTMMIP